MVLSDYVIIEGTPWCRNARCPTVLCRGRLKNTTGGDCRMADGGAKPQEKQKIESRTCVGAMTSIKLKKLKNM